MELNKISGNNQLIEKRVELNSIQLGELEKRGFFVRELLGIKEFLFSLPLILVAINLVSVLGYLISMFMGIYTAYLLLFISLAYLVGSRLYKFIFFAKQFYNNTGVFLGAREISAKEFELESKKILPYGISIDTYKPSGESGVIEGIVESRVRDGFQKQGIYADNLKISSNIIGVILGLPLLGFIYEIIKIIDLSYNIDILSFNYKITLVSLCIFVVGIVIRFLYQLFIPLYAFGNLGEKIQKLTPTIESKSKEIQENFEKDMNFRVLSEGFDSLSSTFSEIVRLVIRLELVEKKANKGNLFDSEKYINSLREDIVEPLKSLKTFLEEQRDKLLESQKELQKARVKVGGSDELNSESELSSKRGESLVLELDENISKLEGMIEKMS